MSLTAHVFHIVGIQVLAIEELPGSLLHVLVGFVVSAMAFACSGRGVSHAALWSGSMAKATGIARHFR